MARKEAGYPMKSPRGRPHDFASRVFDYLEDGIYVIVALLLVVAGVFVLWSTITQLVSEVGHREGVSQVLINLLDNALLLFIVAELLHTVRATIQERTLVVEPFLIVGLIAGVRRLLVLTAQLAAQNTTFSWKTEGVEIVVLLGLILGMTVALVLYHSAHGPATRDDEA